MIRALLVGFAFFSIVSYGMAQENWKLIKNSDNVKVYIKEEPGNEEYINIKAVTFAKGSLQSFAEVMKDVSSYNEWMHAVEETFVVSQENEYHFSYYMLTDFPWPAKDRDAVINMKFDWMPEKKVFKTTSKNVKGLVPVKDNIRRVDEVEASYSFIREDHNKVKIQYLGRIKPGVQLPDWLMEKVYFIAPYNTLKNLRQFVMRGKYRNSQFNLDNI